MIVHLIDALRTLPPFLWHFAASRKLIHLPAPYQACSNTVWKMIEERRDAPRGAPRHVIESFRNGLWQATKTGAGIEPSCGHSFIP